MTTRITMLLAAALLLPFAEAPAQTYPPEMVSYWKFDEGEGTIATDSRDANVGTISGATWVSGQVGGALSFDGNDYVVVPDSPNLDLTGSFTLSAWFYPRTLTGVHHIIKKGCQMSTRCTNYRIAIFPPPHVPPFTVSLGMGRGSEYYMYCFGTTNPIPLEEWTHVAATYSETSGIATVYVNGVSERTCGPANPPYAGNSSLRIGDNYNWEYFDGLIDEVAIYSAELPPEEILRHYENGLIGLGYELIPQIGCAGFEPPMASGAVTVRGNRALPLKAQLVDADNNLVTDLDVSAAPVLQVWYEYGTPDAADVTDEALPAGQSSEGNQFFFDTDQRWHYNLKTKNYSAAGTYTVLMDSGDASEYVVDPTCTGQFVVN